MSSIIARNTQLIQRATSRTFCSSRFSRPSGVVWHPIQLTALGTTPTPVPFASSNNSIRGAFTTSAMAPKAQQVMFEPEVLPNVSLVLDRSNAPVDLDLMLIAVTQEDFSKKEGEEAVLSSDRIKALDGECGGVLADCLAACGFEGKKGTQSSVVRVGRTAGAPAGLLGAKGVAMVGLGKAADLGPNNTTSSWGASSYQALGASVANLAKAQRAVKAGIMLLDAPSGNNDAEKAAAVTQLATGMMLAGYETTRFKSKASQTASKLAELVVLGNGSVLPPGATGEAALAKARAVALGNFVTRYLVEAPPNVCNPTHMAAAAAHIAKQAPETMKLEVLEKAQCEAMNMGLFLGVAECSDEPPKFIHLKYTPRDGGNGKSIALVGKGLTFDSGGYNIKAGPGSLIEMMKFDMGGAGATLGAARMISALQPEGGPEVHFLVASCENMVAGHGLRPGDVLTSANGKTVEVNNTDAEGRLTLADALWYAQEKCKATAIVDTATLTGACMIALGAEIAGLFSPTDEAAADVIAAAKLAGEKLWRMPMEENYFEQLKSPIADMKNTGSRLGGSITASLFLKQFINEGVQWSHVDMAGPVWDEKLNIPTGFGAATLTEWIIAQGKK